ncbi:patatin-like phospholipase family protein [Maricaulis sp.]|uniref:patatin-like phospholipase family protein n=1 Tax=Maricaulis sp. TaxID=1486257 RepID=UPI003A8DBDDE
MGVISDIGHGLRMVLAAGLALAGAAAAAQTADYADGLMTLPPPVTEPNRWTRCNPAPAPCNHPRIALVLSGGGALGIAHVGAIATLERAGVQPDLVVGTSMGAIVGGLYASGYSAAELEEAVLSLDWTRVFSADPPRRSQSYRRRRIEEDFPAELSFDLDRYGLRLPRAFINDQNLNLALRNLVRNPGRGSFDDMPIPFRAVATDIATGAPVSLSEGDLAMAMRASMAVPGALPPEEINGQMLVDGGLSKNIPVDIAQAMGADIIIVVAVQGRLLTAEELRTGVELLTQSMTLLVLSNETAQLALLGPQDILIQVSQGDLTAGDFTRGEELIAAGELAANEVFDRLQALQTHHTPLVAPPVPEIDEVQIHNSSRLSSELLLDHISQRTGAPLDVDALADDLATIYGLGAFDQVSYELARHGEATALVINADARPDDIANIRVGVTLENDFDGDGEYRISLEYRSLPIDPYGSEIRIDAMFGDRFGLSAEMFKLFDTSQNLFVAPRANFVIRNIPRYRADGFRTGSYRATYAEAQLDAGWQFDYPAEVRIGYQRGTGQASLEEGYATPDEVDIDIGQINLSAGIDTLDNAFFPTEGMRLSSQLSVARETLGASADFESLEAHAMQAWSRGADTVIMQLDAGSNLSGVMPLDSLYRLGGLFSLSGYKDEELIGESFALGRLVYRRRLNAANTQAFGVPLYAGVSLEGGNVWADRDLVSSSDITLAGSVFLSADTVLGPVYMAYGRADTGRQSLYLFVGRPF